MHQSLILPHPNRQQTEIMPPQSQFFYGYSQERQKISSYVLKQLNGSDAQQNQLILQKFRQDAIRRKHRKTNSNDYYNTNFNPQKDTNFVRYQPSVNENKSYSSPFANGTYPIINRFKLIPTDKTKPPIYKQLQHYPASYSRITNHRSVTHSIPQRFKKTECIQPISQQRMERERALRRIKETARQKRRRISTIDLDSEEGDIVEELERRKEEVKSQYRYLNRQLQKLKRYRHLSSLP